MSIKKWMLFFVAQICGLSTHAQHITGVVNDSFDNPISRASLLIKTKKDTPAISEFFFTNDQGEFSIHLKKKYQTTIYIEANALNYEKTIDSLVLPKSSKVYRFDFVLFPKITKLDEVIISERKKFEIKKDTVVFNPEAYKDGTERKVEDLLKKLPGIEVAGDGSIKYRGKGVQAVQLDGDDLFGDNYTIGTKNIGIDMVEEIEAIEHYSKNPLLKGIENSDNVALNLKLKKGKVDYSGSSTLGYGYGDKPYYDISSTLLGVAKRMKSVGIFSYNTIGLNKTAFDYFSNALTVEDINNEKLYSKKIIDQTPIHSVLGSARTRINDEWSGNYNFIYKLSPKLKLKSNLYYVKDKFFRQEVFQHEYTTGTEVIKYTDRTDITKTPENKRADLKFTYNSSKNSLIEFDTSISKEDIIAQNNLTRNLETTATTRLKSSDFFWKNALQATYKLGSSIALQFKSLYAKNNTPQQFNTFGNFTSDEIINSTYNQVSEHRKESFQNRLVLLGKKNTIKYALTLGTNYYNNTFSSSLLENEIEPLGFQNRFDYKNTKHYTLFNLSYAIKKWKFEPMLSLNYLRQKLEDDIDTTTNKNRNLYYAEPSLHATYKINSVSKLRYTGTYQQQTPKENFLFNNNIINSNRSLLNNEVDLTTAKQQNYALTYSINDLHKNLDLNLIVNYSNRKNVYVSNLEITPNYTRSTFFQSPSTLDDWFLKGSIKRYVRFLKTTIKHTSGYTISNFKNIVNQSEIRDGQSKNYKGSIFAKTAFRIPINFENNTTYAISSYSVSKQLQNTNSSITNIFKTIVRPNKNWVFTLFYYYFKPDITNQKDFSFLDFSIRYRPQKIKWISGRIVGKNLLDNKVFEQVENSDYATTIYQSNLIPRYFMLSLDINF